MREEYLGCGDEYNSSLAAARTIDKNLFTGNGSDWQPSLPGNPNDYLVCIKPNGTIQIGGKVGPQLMVEGSNQNYVLNRIIAPVVKYAFTKKLDFWVLCSDI